MSRFIKIEDSQSDSVDQAEGKPLDGDIVLHHTGGSGFADGKPVYFHYELIYRHRERKIISESTRTGKPMKTEVELEYIPESIVTEEALIRYAKEHGVFLPM